MKKTLLLVAAVAMAMVARAWEVGDFYANDPSGVPALVVYVDESGEHGLIMSPKALTEKGYKQSKKAYEKNKKWANSDAAKRRKKIQKNGDDLALQEFDRLYEQQQANYAMLTQWLENAPRLFDGKYTEKQQRKAIESLASSNTEFGEENQKDVLAYCNSNDVDITHYFRQFEYALNLGDGWFIPGNFELELYSKHFVEAMGEKHHISFQKKIDMDKALREKLGPVGDWMVFNLFFATDAIQSSTMLRSAWAENPENKEKMDVQIFNTNWDFKDNYFSLCVFTRKITMYYWWTFAKNLQGSSHIVAFKRF